MYGILSIPRNKLNLILGDFVFVNVGATTEFYTNYITSQV
jgi:hypothetical protein